MLNGKRKAPRPPRGEAQESALLEVGYSVANWERFQHYTKRRPPWIKVYRTLLDDRDFAALSPESRALALQLWLLAADSVEGSLPPKDQIAWRLRMTAAEVSTAMEPLIDAGYFCPEPFASISLAPSMRVAGPEKRKRKRKKEETKPRTGETPCNADATDIECPQGDRGMSGPTRRPNNMQFAPEALDLPPRLALLKEQARQLLTEES